MRLLARYPEIGHDSFCTEVIRGNLSEVDRLLARRPLAASGLCDTPDPQREEAAGDDWLKDLGPKGWQPLMYLCSTRLALPTVAENSLAIARMLLDSGADPNVFFMAGSSKYTPLVAAIGEGEDALHIGGATTWCVCCSIAVPSRTTFKSSTTFISAATCCGSSG